LSSKTWRRLLCEGSTGLAEPVAPSAIDWAIPIKKRSR
jgi:hypothetical protein